MTYGLASPWQNRPSLISCWEHSGSFEDLTGVAFDFLGVSMHSISTLTIPVCVPRACRLTRACIIQAHQDDVVGTFDLIVEKSTDCGANFLFSQTVEVPFSNSGFITNCFCADFNIPFDQCDVWRCYLGFTDVGGFTDIIGRVNLHFELR